jgi:hypothetical protein
MFLQSDHFVDQSGSKYGCPHGPTTTADIQDPAGLTAPPDRGHNVGTLAFIVGTAIAGGLELDRLEPNGGVHGRICQSFAWHLDSRLSTSQGGLLVVERL